MRRWFVFVVCFAMIASAAPALAAPSDNPAGKQRVIVQVRPGNASPGGLADQIVRTHGGRLGAVYEHALKGFAAELPQAAIIALSRNPNVVSITPDQIITIADQDIPTGFDRIEADLAPAAPTSPIGCPPGEACTDADIAVLDTGSNNHPDLNIVHRADCSAILGPCTDNAGYDGHGHGTHVAGIAAALDNGHGVVGVAPGARIWSVKVLGDDGTGFLTSLIAGVDWVAARAGEIDVVNMSLAGAFSDASFDTAIANSVAAGITFVAAAGNEGGDAAVNSPANHPDVITVSAVADGDAAGGGLGKFLCRQDQADDTLATFSNFGAVVDIAAPGVCIRSTWSDGGYATKSGTSMASPYVAGAAARYLAIHPGAEPATVKTDLLAGSIPQSEPAGFIGDGDGFPEPLLFVNSAPFNGNGVRTVANSDSTGPSTPTVGAEADGYTVDVAWGKVADPESGVLSYRVKRDGVLIAEVDHATFSFQDRGNPDTTYAYTVQAVNRQGKPGDSSPSVAASTSADDPSDAGWWAFEEASGAVAADSSAWRRSGRLSTTGAGRTAGKVGGALSLDGSGGRVDLDSTVLDGAGDVTAAMWMKTTKTGTALISGANPGNSNEYLVYLNTATNVRLYTGSSATAGVSWNLPYSVADGAWHHLAVVRDDTRNRADLYLDGTWVGAWGVGLDPIDVEPGGLVIGQSQDGVGGKAFAGALDEVRLYTRVVSAAEIAILAMRDETPPGAPAGLSATTDVLRVDLSWSAADDPESGIAGYEIWRGTTSTKTLLAEVAGTSTSYGDARTNPLTQYFYEIRAVNGAGLTGVSSPEASATTGEGLLDPALMGWWELDETTGTNAADSSDHGLDGTLANGPVWDPAGQIGGGLAFDGSNWVDLDSQILDGAGDVTAALWVKTTKSYIQGLVSAANTGNDAEFELVLLSNPDQRLRFYTGETNTTYVWWPVPGVADGTWHHLAVTRDAAGDEAVLYVDGVSQGSRSAVFEQLNVDGGGLLFGQDQDSVGAWNEADQSFVGSLDDLRLYRRLLSDTEIADLAGMSPPDTTPPVITLVGADPQVIEGGEAYVELGASAVDNIDGDISGDLVIDSSAVDVLMPGSYAVTYDVVDSSGNAAAQVIRTVHVVDTTPPVITLVGANPQTVEGGDPYVELGATATDIVDGEVTGSIRIDASDVNTSVPGSYAVAYDVDDAAGNAAAQVVRTVDVVDTTAPVITLFGDPVVSVGLHDGYVDAGVSAVDLVDGDVSSLVVTGGLPVDTSMPGSYTVTYDVVDSAGNAADRVVRTVNVVAAPVVVDIHAGSETTVLGVVAAGDLSATIASDDTYEVLAEQHQGGRPSQRVSSLDHRWTFEIGNPEQVVLNVEARRDINSEGDDFSIEYSTDGTTFLPLLLINFVNDTSQQAVLPDGTSGTVTVRVIDKDRTAGNAESDSVFIDELFLQTTSGSSGLPQVSVVATDPNASEAGASGEFTLTRSDSAGTLTVEVDLAGSAGPGDYQPVDTPVEFVAGSPTATLVISPINDTVAEGSETVTLTVVPGSGYSVGIPGSAEVTIADDDVVAVDEVAHAEVTVFGTAAPAFTATHTADNTYEAITEESYVGGKRSRLEHIWTFDVIGGSTVVFSVEAHRFDTSDEFVFAYSTDGAGWTDMLAVSKTSDDDAVQTYTLPPGVSGAVYVRVQDTDRSRDDPDLATVWVDHMFIRSG